jgi:hypothetical protein
VCDVREVLNSGVTIRYHSDAFSEGRDNGTVFRFGLPCPDEALPG